MGRTVNCDPTKTTECVQHRKQWWVGDLYTNTNPFVYKHQHTYINGFACAHAHSHIGTLEEETMDLASRSTIYYTDHGGENVALL